MTPMMGTVKRMTRQRCACGDSFALIVRGGVLVVIRPRAKREKKMLDSGGKVPTRSWGSTEIGRAHV